MKKIIIGIILIIFVAVSATFIYIKKQDAKCIGFEVVSSYVIKDTIPLSEEEFNYFLIENADEVSTLFDLADANPPSINFDKEFLIAVTTSPTSKDSKIEINKVKLSDNSVYVDFSYIEGEATNVVSVPSKIITIEKPENVLDLYFVQDGVISKKIALGRRNLDSPKSEKDFLQNYTGHFSGTFPFTNNSQLKNNLTINRDGTYSYEKLSDAKTSAKENGTWKLSADLAVIELVEAETYFYITDKNTLELMSPDVKRINSHFNYKLTRQ